MRLTAMRLPAMRLPAIHHAGLPPRVMRWPALLGASLCLVACGTPPGSFDEEQSAQTKWNNLVAMVQFKKVPGQPDPASKVVCPDIAILDGTADDRVYGTGGQTNANVRYQFSLYDVARDCKIAGDQIALRVGASGKVLLGPVGSPGTFDAPIRVAVIRISDQEPIVSKLFHVPVSVAAGNTEAPFTLVTEDLSVPYTHANSQHDYIIKVGFDAAGNDKRTKAMIDAAASRRVRANVATSGSSGRHHGHHRLGSSPND